MGQLARVCARCGVGGRGFCSMIYETAVRPSFVISRHRPIPRRLSSGPGPSRFTAAAPPYQMTLAVRPASVVL